jgi:NADPH2:quinone reductase
MKAVVCSEFGGPEALTIETIEERPPGKGEVCIEVHACGVNFPDVLMVHGKHQLTPELPFYPGGEISGVVREVAPGVEGLNPGQRVMAVTFWGGLAESVNARARSVVAVPDDMDFVTAAVFQGGHSVSHYALKRRGQLQSGETLLVLGAAGGVGLAAVQLGKAMGARVIAAVGSDEKANCVRQNGADEVINYSTEDLREKAKALTGGRGAEVILDPVGGDQFDQAARCINVNGRILVVGFASGRIPQYPVNLALLKSCSIVGVNHQHFFVTNPGQADEDMAELLQMYSDGKIKPVIDQVYPMDQAAEALKRVGDRQAIGKVVVSLRS